MLKDRKCLAVMGRAGAGKDTLVTMVEEYFFAAGVAGFSGLRFSAPLKSVCCQIFGWDRASMNELEYKEETLPSEEWPKSHDGRCLITRREILQYLGTDVFRKLDPDIWVKAAIREAAAEEDLTGADFVSTDCRFPNEQRALVKAFKSVLFVKIHRAGDGSTPSHSSENIDLLHADIEFHVQSGDMTRMRQIARLIAEDFMQEGI